MVFEYMDHDLTGLAARPGMHFTVPQIKVLCPSLHLAYAFVFSGLPLETEQSNLVLTVLYEAALNWASLLPRKSSAASGY